MKTFHPLSLRPSVYEEALQCLLTQALLLSFVSACHAAISVGPAGTGTLTFDTPPAVSDWSTRVWTGNSTDLTNGLDLNIAVETNMASAINTTLHADAANPPLTNGLGLWSSSGFFIATRPTAVVYAGIMAR